MTIRVSPCQPNAVGLGALVFISLLVHTCNNTYPVCADAIEAVLECALTAPPGVLSPAGQQHMSGGQFDSVCLSARVMRVQTSQRSHGGDPHPCDPTAPSNWLIGFTDTIQSDRSCWASMARCVSSSEATLKLRRTQCPMVRRWLGLRRSGASSFSIARMSASLLRGRRSPFQPSW